MKTRQRLLQMAVLVSTVLIQTTLYGQYYDYPIYNNMGQSDGTAWFTGIPAGSDPVVNIPSTIDGLLIIGVGYPYGGCLWQTSPVSVTIPDSVETISSDAFEFCTDLVSVEIPGSVTSIGEDAFADCGNLTNVTLPYGIISIGHGAFGSCSSLTSMNIPASATNLDTDVFGESENLTAITVDPQNPVYSSMNGLLLDKNQTTLIQFPAGITGNVTLPNSITSIGTFAFDGSELTDVIVPSDVTNVSDYGFCVCPNLAGILFTGNAPDFGLYVFQDNHATLYYLPGTAGWTNVTNAVLWDPTISVTNNSFGMPGNPFGFTITGTPDIPIVISATTNLATGPWIQLQACTVTNGSIYFSDPCWTNYATRFYTVQFP